MGINITKVPRGWEHPRDERGQFVQPVPYDIELEHWIYQHQLWQERKHPDQAKNPDCEYYADYAGDPPSIQAYKAFNYLQKDAVCFQVYERVTEGTPISPVFETLKEVENWLVTALGYTEDYAKVFIRTEGTEYLWGSIGAKEENVGLSNEKKQAKSTENPKRNSGNSKLKGRRL